MSSTKNFGRLAHVAALCAALSLAACGGGSGGSDASESTTGKVVSSIVGGPFVAPVGNSIQIQGAAFTEQSNIAGMKWSSTPSVDATAPALTLGNANCDVATKNDVKYPATGARATGTSAWGCALALAAPSALTKTTDYTVSLTTTDDRAVSHTASTKVTYVIASGSTGSTTPTLSADAGLNFSLLPGATGSLHCSGSGGKPSASGYAYQWSVTNNAGYNLTLTSYTAADTTFVAPAATVATDLAFKCAVVDSLGAAASGAVTARVAPVVVPPPPVLPPPPALVVNPGLGFSLLPGATGALHCSASGGTPLPAGGYNYQWSVTGNGGYNVSLSSYTSADATFTAPAVSGATSLAFQCTAVDNLKVASSASVAVTVTPASNTTASLVASAGNSNVTATPGQTVPLNGSATGWFDAKGAPTAGPPISYQWTTSYPGVTIQNANAATTSFVVPTSITSPTTIPFTLTATSGGSTSTASAQFLVDPYGPFTLTVNPPAQAVMVGTAASITAMASSSSGQTLYYQWIQTSGPAASLGGTTTATVGFVPSVAGTYNFQVNVGYQPITGSYPGVYRATATVTAQ